MLLGVYASFLTSLISESEHEVSAQEVGLASSAGAEETPWTATSHSLEELRLLQSQLGALLGALHEHSAAADPETIRSAIDSLQGLQLLPSLR